MKLRINICHIYFFVILLCALNGTLYAPGGILAQGFQAVLILISLYYAFYANSKYKLPLYFKALNVLLIMFTIYGVILLTGSGSLSIQGSYMELPKTEYLKTIYKSLLPVYPFFVFTKQGLLKESTLKVWFFIFIVFAIRSFFITRAAKLQAAIERGSSAEEFTLNIGYSFVALLPALVLFYKKPLIQYAVMMICFYFIVAAMKRGAIICGVICLVWFIVTNLKKVQGNRKLIVLVISLAMVLGGIYLYYYMLESSSYFRYRLESTMEGDSSMRDEIYQTLWSHFIHEGNALRFLFGYGANATVKIASNLAHNDWLEIATNQGLIGLVIYLVYWICFYITWRRTKQYPQAFMAIGMLLIIYLLMTLFSMSYNVMTKSSTMVLGYYLAIADKASSSSEQMV